MTFADRLRSFVVCLQSQADMFIDCCFCSFGITPTKEKLYHDGIMHTTVDDCQFLCVPQYEYYRILHEVKYGIVQMLYDNHCTVMLIV